MRALILAAGIGSRLGHITAGNPKAMVPISDKPEKDALFYGYQMDGY